MGRSDYYSSCSCKLTTKFAFLFAGPRRQVQNNPAAAVNLRSVLPRACNPNTAMRDFRPCTSLSSCCFPGHGSRPRSPYCGYEAAGNSAGGESEHPQNPHAPRPAPQGHPTLLQDVPVWVQEVPRNLRQIPTKPQLPAGQNTGQEKQAESAPSLIPSWAHLRAH